MIQEKEKNLALITHLSGFGSYLFPLGSIIIPFVIRETKKNDSAFMEQLTKDVINFNLSYLLYTFIIKLLVVPMFIGDILENLFAYKTSYNFDGDIDNEILGILSFGTILTIMAIVKFILIAKAAIKTHNGEDYKYPYVIDFIN